MGGAEDGPEILSVVERKTLPVAPAQAGRTVLRILHDLGGFTHRTARGMILAGGVHRNGRAVRRVDERVEPGDRIELVYEPEKRYRGPRTRREPLDFRIVHEDHQIVVADKAAGLLTVPTPSGAAESLQEKLSRSYQSRGYRAPTVLPVHRIDRYTSGLVAFALTEPAWRQIRAQFAAGLPERVYLAVAQGRVEPDEGTLVHHLEEHPRSLKIRAGRHRREGSKRASLAFVVRERFAEATLLEVRLETGRRNQIRVQLAAMGHPIVGDHAYGRPSPFIGRTALHAKRLSFDHPARGTRLTFDSDPPEDFQKLLATLRGRGR